MQTSRVRLGNFDWVHINGDKAKSEKERGFAGQSSSWPGPDPSRGEGTQSFVLSIGLALSPFSFIKKVPGGNKERYLHSAIVGRTNDDLGLINQIDRILPLRTSRRVNLFTSLLKVR